MTAFDGRLRVLGETGLPLGVEVDLTSDRITMTSGESRIADWAFADISISPTSNGFRIEAEGEEVILNVTNAEAFTNAIGIHLRQL